MSIYTALLLYGLTCLFTVVAVHALCKLAPIRDYEDDQDRLTRLALEAKRQKELEAIQKYLDEEAA